MFPVPGAPKGMFGCVSMELLPCIGGSSGSQHPDGYLVPPSLSMLSVSGSGRGGPVIGSRGSDAGNDS